MWRCIVAGSIRISPYHIFFKFQKRRLYPPRVHAHTVCAPAQHSRESPLQSPQQSWVSGGDNQGRSPVCWIRGWLQTDAIRADSCPELTGCHGWENMEKSNTWGSEHQLWEHKKTKGWEMAMGQGAVSGQQWWWRSRRLLGRRCSLKACGKTQDAAEDEDWGRQHTREESEEPSGRKRTLRVAAPNQSTHRGAL